MDSDIQNICGSTDASCDTCTTYFAFCTTGSVGCPGGTLVDCSPHLQAADSALTDVTLAFDDAVSTKVNLGVDHSNFFKTTDSLNCAYDSCTLFDQDCSTPYSGPSNFEIATSNPW